MKTFTSRIAMASALSLAFVASPVLAEDNSESASDSAENEDDPHYRGNIIVAADGLEELDFIAGQDVIDLDDIQRDLNGQLGDLLIKVPGVSATSFTPGASRPILRGLDGERVCVLIDGLGRILQDR